VLIDRELEGVHTFAVHSDYQSGLREATESLLVMGHRRIAFITGPPDIRTTRQRLSGYRLAHADHAIPVIEPLVRLGSYHQGWGYSQMTELLRSDEPPTAVIAGSLSILYGILAAARDSGVRLGRDLSVISCDETELLQYLEPPVNVVRRDPFTLGEIAAELLLGALSPGFDGVPVVRVVPTQYVMRAPVQPPGAS
jgi:DNA-binding LacI/PurR family transcriptional regulator